MTLRLPSTRKPTLLNQDMLFGALMGIVTYPPIAPLAALLCGAYGRIRMQKEEKEGGRIIEQPGFLNRFACTGMWAGMALGKLLVFADALYHISLNSYYSISSASVSGAIHISEAILGIAGLVLGGRYGIKKMQVEYDLAFRQRYMVQDRSPSHEQEHAPDSQNPTQHVENLKKRESTKDENDRGDSQKGR